MNKQKFYINGKLIVFLLGLLLIIFLNFNIVEKQASNNQKIRVVASFYPMYFFASQIGGEKAEVENITPSGAEPHDYEPTAQDIAHIEKSPLLILNGGKFEAWGDKIKENIKDKNIIIVVAGGTLANRQIDEHGKIIQDPHVWLSPPLAKQEVKNILNGFIKVDPADQSYYRDNEQKLENELDQLNSQYKHELQNCMQKDIITSHAAFGYLAKTYGLNQVSIAGLSPDEEPSAKQLAEVSNFAKKHNMKYIFFESLISPKLSETIAHEIGAQTLVLDPIEGISQENINKGINYFSLMRANLINLKKALECR